MKTVLTHGRAVAALLLITAFNAAAEVPASAAPTISDQGSVIMALVPGLPTIPFLVLAIISGTIAYRLNKHNLAATIAAQAKTAADAKGAPGTQQGPEKMESLLNVEPLQIELGYGLISLADTRKGGDLVERITGVRRTFAQEMGILVPLIRLRDNLSLGANEYRFLLKGNPIAHSSLMPGYWLAMNASNSRVTLKGVATVEPVFQLPATWILSLRPSKGKASRLLAF